VVDGYGCLEWGVGHEAKLTSASVGGTVFETSSDAWTKLYIDDAEKIGEDREKEVEREKARGASLECTTINS
jgi:hypothetical protein